MNGLAKFRVGKQGRIFGVFSSLWEWENEGILSAKG